MLNFKEVDKGVATGLQEVIPARWIISRVYLCWLSNKPIEVDLTSMPKKK